MSVERPPYTRTFVPQPDFTSVFWLTVALVLCYLGMIASGLSGSVMVIYFILLFPVFVGLVGGTVGVLARKLLFWQVDCAEARTDHRPTLAQVETARIARGFMWAFFGTLAIGLVLFLMQDEAGTILCVPPLIFFGYGWFKIALLKPPARARPTVPTATARTPMSVPLVRRRRPQNFKAQPGTRPERLETSDASYDSYLGMLKRKEELRRIMLHQTLKRVLLWTAPLVVVHFIIDIAAPGSLAASLSGKVIAVTILLVALLPQSSPSSRSPLRHFRLPKRSGWSSRKF